MADEDGLRVKRFWIGRRELLNVLVGFRTPDMACVPDEHGSIPEGSTVRMVKESHLGNCIDVYLEHPSFEVVPDGMSVPDGEPIDLKFRLVQLVHNVGTDFSFMTLDDLRALRDRVAEEIYDRERDRTRH